MLRILNYPAKWLTYNSIIDIDNPITITVLKQQITITVLKQQKIKIGNAEGYECDRCKTFHSMAELNQPDGSDCYMSFTCYECRNDFK